MTWNRRLTQIAGWISGIVAIVCLYFAWQSSSWNRVTRHDVGVWIVGIWVAVPPLWFWFEWRWLTMGMQPDELERMKHYHELSRNLWLALIALLLFGFGLADLKP